MQFNVPGGQRSSSRLSALQTWHSLPSPKPTMCSDRNLRMLKQDLPCNAIAEAIAMCRPSLICAYSDTPQARILERLVEMAKAGALADCEFINVTSDFAAMAVAIGASAAGTRTYMATSSNGLLFMAEAVYHAAGAGLPIVMTISNCATTAPLTAWNDHTDSMSMRDAGWIQLYAETNQEAVDLHVQAFHLAEDLSCPVMVCVDSLELARVDDPKALTQAQVDAYLPPFEPRERAGTGPAFIGGTADPETYTEMRYLAHHRQLRALSVIPRLASEFQARFGRPAGGLLRTYRTEDADTVVVALGSVNGIARKVVDELRAEGVRIGSINLCSFRPFPLGALRDALQGAKRVVVLERSLAVGLGGILSDGVSRSISGIAIKIYTVIVGLGGRGVTRASLRQLFDDATQDELEHVTFLDLNADLVASQLEREMRTRGYAQRAHEN
jgi:pyruvate ferredoxin oxidoreductase alpha subunit